MSTGNTIRICHDCGSATFIPEGTEPEGDCPQCGSSLTWVHKTPKPPTVKISIADEATAELDAELERTEPEKVFLEIEVKCEACECGLTAYWRENILYVEKCEGCWEEI